MKKLLMITVSLLGIALFLERYLNNPVPPDLEQAWILNLFTGLISIITDASLVGVKLGLCEDRACVRYGIAFLGYADTLYSHSYSQGVNITETEFDGVPVTIYSPEVRGSALSGGLILIHGGGWIAGTARNYDRVSSDWVRDLGITIVAVEYRLAPEFPSPIPLQDCETATRYFIHNAHLYGVDSSEIGVLGESAGGNLATALTIKLRDSPDDIQFKYQVLLYPLLQGLDINLPSYEQNEKWAFSFTTRWSVAGVIATYLDFWDYKEYTDLIKAGAHVSPGFRAKYGKYVNWQEISSEYISNDYAYPYQIKTLEDHMTKLNQLGFTDENEIHRVISKFETGLADPLNFPLMAEDLSNLPPAYVLACEYDTLRDDALLYARRLEDAGNTIVLDYQRQGWHGYLVVSTGHFTVTSAANVFQNVTQFIKKSHVRH